MVAESTATQAAQRCGFCAVERSETSKNGRRSSCGISHRVGPTDDWLKQRWLRKAQRRRPHAKRVSSRTQSVFHRAGGRFRSETKWTREEVCSVLWPILACHLQTHSVFHRAHGVCFIADAERLSPRRGLFPFWKRSGRGRGCLPFRARSAIRRAVGFHRSAARRTREGAPAVPGTECHSSRRGFSPFCSAPDARGHAHHSGHGVPFVAPWVFTVL